MNSSWQPETLLTDGRRYQTLVEAIADDAILTRPGIPGIVATGYPLDLQGARRGGGAASKAAGRLRLLTRVGGDTPTQPSRRCDWMRICGGRGAF
jgi:hypothetical protein